MYGTAGSSTYDATHANANSSTIKQYLDSWYKTNIEDAGYDDAVSDTLFCGDRSLDTVDNSGSTGIGTTSTYYGAYNRLITNKEPILTCPQENDAYTVDDEAHGNGALTYPVALISADEMAMAGALYIDLTTSKYYNYLFKYSKLAYWSLTPMNRVKNYTRVFAMDGNGSIYFYEVNSSYGVAPVINLTPEYVSNMSGTGTMTDPYTA